jgi:hypothetical protein
MKSRLKNLETILTNNTVLTDWFAPLQAALDKVRFSDNIFTTLSMKMFILQNCVRQINNSATLREHLQHLFHLDDTATVIPLAKSTYSDALSSDTRLGIVSDVVDKLVTAATDVLPDRLSGLEGIGDRPVYGMDCTYQDESCHFNAITPRQGGTDSSKGHLQLTVFDLKTGIPLNTDIDTRSIAEIRFVKEHWRCDQLTQQKNSLWAVDRGFIDAGYWDIRKHNYGVTMITRMKSNLNYSVINELKVTCSSKKQGIKTDQIIQLNSSKKPWRLIGYYSDTGEYYEYLTNEFELKSGVVAFLYHRRWDEEKFFDNYKNDMANAKAWGKSKTAIRQQALIGIITFVLTRLFSEKQAKQFDMPTDGNTQKKRHQKKRELYLAGKLHDQLRAFHTNLSKVTKQVWRFLKGCMLKTSRKQLYEAQLKPLMNAYI